MPAPSWPGGRTGAIFTQRGRAARWVAAAALDVQIARGAGCGVGVLVRYFVLARGWEGGGGFSAWAGETRLLI
jgi:hypothetical protein